jgi:hypothetical protein
MAGHLVPFIAQDIDNLYKTSGPAGLAAAPLDLFGVGVQAYKAKPPKQTGGSSRSNPYDVGVSTGVSPYDQSPVGGGGSPYSQPAVP